MAYDIVIKGGLVFDGSGNAPTVADIGINGDRIAAIGSIRESGAETVINAGNKYVTPGFIDVTNHSDTHLTLFKYPNLESLLMQGVTTILGGNCGASLAPLGSRYALDAIRKWADPSDINVNWDTVDSYLNALDLVRPGVNVGAFAGYGTLRRGVIGNEIRLLTLEEREQVKYLLRQALTDGAFGLSVGLAYGHEKVSTTEELIEIAKVLAETGGALKLHLRSEGAEILASVNEAVRIGRESGAPIRISHFKTIGRKAWPFFSNAIQIIENARASGLDIMCDVSPYRTTGSPLYLLIPSWARQGGFAELFRRIDTPDEQKKILEAMRGITLHYDKILILSAKVKSAVGRTIQEIADNTGFTPEETLLQMVRVNEGRVSIIGRTVSGKNTASALMHRQSLIASDGAGYSQDAYREGNLIHPRSFGAFPHFWHKFVTDTGKISASEAIQKLTAYAARAFGIRERGEVRENYFADLLVFDPKLFRDRATYKNPFRYPSGMEWVVVNGKIAVREGRPIGERAGRVLRRKET